MENELLKMDQEVANEGGFIYKNNSPSAPSSVKSGAYRRNINLKTPSTNESMRVADENDQ